MSGASVHSLLPRYPLTAITNSPSGPVDFALKGELSQGYLSVRTDPCGGNGKLHIGGQLMPGVHNWQQGPAGLGKPGSRQTTFDPKAALHLPSSPRSSSVVSGNSTQTQQYAQGPAAPPPRPTYSQLTQSYSRAELPQQTEAWSSFQSPRPSLSNRPSLTDHTGCLPLPPLPPIRTSLPEPYPTAPTFAKRQRVDPPTMFLQQPLNLQMQQALLNAQQHVQRVNEVLNWVPRWVPPPPDDSEDDEDLLISGPEFMRAEVNIWRGSC
ncbi:hypothetical protein V8C86DRAFT_2538452 [Haematococcus lacustris]